jgi:hypothetical protein
MKRRSALRASFAATGAALAATAAALDPQRFVAGWPIDAPAGAEVFDVPLTAEIYAAAAGIEQLAVLDANGTPQPFFRRTPPRADPTEARLVLEASPLFADATPAAPSVGVTTSGRGTSVTVTADADGSPAVTGFVLDARDVESAPIALELDWRALPQPFLLEVTVEQSTDLTSWRTVGRASVAALSIDGAEVRHARVPIRAGQGGYLRVTPKRTVADWRLERAALVSSTAAPAETSSVRIAPLAEDALPDDAEENALYFDAGAALPVAAVALAFTNGDGWARADVAASRSLDGPWATVAYADLFYALSFEGNELASEPVTVGRQEARYWRVIPSAPLRGQTVELELTFPQEYLRVAANGGGPYLLAAGTLAEEAGPDATLASVFKQLEQSAAAVPLAALGERRELGGPAALVPEWRFPWRTAALWTVLIGGVLVVGAMAVRLARETRSQPS